MFKKIMAALLLAGLFLTATGCGNGDPTVADEGMISIEVVNSTDEIFISYAAFFGPGLEEWGEDLLGDEAIPPGQSATFILPEGEYNLSLFTFELYVIDNYWDISEDQVIEVGAGGKYPILFENSSPHAVGLFFALPSGMINLEDDESEEDYDFESDVEGFSDDEYYRYQLLDEREIVIAENGRRFFFLEPGVYDFLIINMEMEPYFVQEREVVAGQQVLISIQ